MGDESYSCMPGVMGSSTVLLTELLRSLAVTGRVYSIRDRYFK